MFLVQLDRAWDCGGHWHRVICADCGKRGKDGICGEEAATNWNSGIYEDALPRALTWTTEPPSEAGHYWCRYKSEGKESWSVAYVPAVTNWEKRNMDEHDRIEWAGPIPAPKEQTP